MDVRGCQMNLAESPAQLLLEVVAVNQYSIKKVITGSQRGNISRKPYKNSGNLIGKKLPTKSSNTQVLEVVKNTSVSVLGGVNKTASLKATNPMKQREYRRPDGRKKIIPEAVGVPMQQDIPNGTNGPMVELTIIRIFVRILTKDIRHIVI